MTLIHDVVYGTTPRSLKGILLNEAMMASGYRANYAGFACVCPQCRPTTKNSVPVVVECKAPSPRPVSTAASRKAQRDERRRAEEQALRTEGMGLGIDEQELARITAYGIEVLRTRIARAKKEWALCLEARKLGCETLVVRTLSETGYADAERVLANVFALSKRAQSLHIAQAVAERIGADDLPGAEALVTSAQDTARFEAERTHLQERIHLLELRYRTEPQQLLDTLSDLPYDSRPYRKQVHAIELAIERAIAKAEYRAGGSL